MSRDERELSTRLAALARAVELARGRCAPERLAPATTVLDHAAQRRRLAPERTVAALAGGTGSGKSTLFNALVGEPLAPTGVRRPTTSRARAAIWPPAGEADGGAAALLDWLDVRDRHQLAATRADERAGLVLVDLPDFDSTSLEHRLEVDRLTEVVDLLVWVLDPQKYADAAVHEQYLRRLTTHADVMVVVLNQVDRLPDDAVAGCLRHLRGLLAEDGLAAVPVVATSATTGVGIAALGDELAARARSRTAAVRRLEADVDAAVGALEPLCAGSATGRRAPAPTRSEEHLVAALSRAAGTDVVADAVGASYRRRAIGRVGWPVTRWLARIRPDPLRRLQRGAAAGGTSPAGLSPGVQRAQIANAVRAAVDERAGALPPEWRRSAAAVAERGEPQLAGALDGAVRRADVTAEDAPRWWSAVRAAQLVLVVLAAAGAVWLAALAGLAYLQLPHPSVHVGRAPVPTVLLVGGLALGLLLAVAVRPLVRVGARRRRARTRRVLHAAVRAVAQRSVLDPLGAELRAAGEFCDALDAARRR